MTSLTDREICSRVTEVTSLPMATALSAKEAEAKNRAGGPMSVHDEDRYLWLMHEKSDRPMHCPPKIYIRSLSGIAANGGRARRPRIPGPVEADRRVSGRAVLAGKTPLSSRHFHRCSVFQWHGETCDLPLETIHLARSEAYSVQAVEHAYAAGLQFHLEVTGDVIGSLIRECGCDIQRGLTCRLPRKCWPTPVRARLSGECASRGHVVPARLHRLETAQFA